MAKNNSDKNILVKVDQQNLIYIDPNSVLDEDGVVQTRDLKQEELVFYVNLEADLIPRTKLYTSGDSNTITPVASGVFNMLRNTNGQDYDTKWTETFNSSVTLNDNGTQISNNYDKTSQSFGIKNINIDIKGMNFVPMINIEFIDVRGKTLFESPKNSPYKAFFHLPWPIFYLTIKGYYGKAIRYRLHMVRFNSKFNQNGNFVIETSFVGSTYAYLSDISLSAILNSPYMYLVENTKQANENTKTGLIEQKISQTTKGFTILKSVYDEYKAKGYIPKTFPNKTLKEVIISAQSLEKILEEKLFSEIINPEILQSLSLFENILTNLSNAVKNWNDTNLSQDNPETIDNTTYYLLKKDKENKYNTDLIIGKDIKSLTTILQNKKKEIDNNNAFGKNRDKKFLKKLKTEIRVITIDGLFENDVLKKDFYKTNINGTNIGLAAKKIMDYIATIQAEFVSQRNVVEKIIEVEINKIVKRNDIGIGFEPTIRNIFAVIMANADTYIRLLQDVHFKATQSALERSKLLGSTDEFIYPWPEIVKKQEGDRFNVLTYPGDETMVDKLKSDNSILWPEVDFIENFIEITTKRLDPLTNKEIDPSKINWVFEKDSEISNINQISSLLSLEDIIPYSNKSVSNIVYEIFERGYYTTAFMDFYDVTLRELAIKEFENLRESIKNDSDVLSILNVKGKTYPDLLDLMKVISPFERYPYYEDKTPSIGYIKELTNSDFKIEKDITLKGTNVTTYPELTANLNNYVNTFKGNDYRLNRYPFNSETYESYIGKKITKNDFNFNNILYVDGAYGFITSKFITNIWVDSNFKDNFFNKTISLDDGTTSGMTRKLLNTPYFHKALYEDYKSSNRKNEKYVKSAYLLLNSLPFKDLDDELDFKGNKILMSSLFREVGSTHMVPYFLLLKWGALYHRYKTQILNGVDILNGITNPIDEDLFFDENIGYPFLTLTGRTYGVYPQYQKYFFDVVNNYTFWNEVQTYDITVNSGATINYITKPIYGDGNDNFYSSVVDNSKYDPNEKIYTILPSAHYSYNVLLDNSELIAQDTFRIVFSENNVDEVVYSGLTLPTSYEYFKTTGNTFSLSTSDEFKKVLDLIGTFKPEILDEFESLFLKFTNTTEDLTDITTFQGFLRSLVCVEKIDDDMLNKEIFFKDKLPIKQNKNQKDLTDKILSSNYFYKLTISNPKEYNPYIYNNYVGNTNSFIDEDFDYPTQSGNTKYITLYLGEDIDGHYLDFFNKSNIALNDENVKKYRSLILLYAGYVKSGQPNNKASYVSYIKTNIILPHDERNNLFFGNLTRNFSSFENKKAKRTSIKRGFNEDKTTKLELYNYFKSINDKWIGGNSIGQTSLMDEFLFLDMANRDIGDKMFLNLNKLNNFLDSANASKSLYAMISDLITGTGFDMRPLPAYVNFYGSNFNNNGKITPSKKLADNLFGTFLDVDYVEAQPKIVLQYTGPLSKHLEMGDISSDVFKYKNDSFHFPSTDNNQLIIPLDSFKEIDFKKENRVVGFEVNIGDQNQNIFKSVSLDQSTLKNTTESFKVLEQLARSESGSQVAPMDVDLFDYYRLASYYCEVTCMGNVQIQPTMYFYLNNVPLFRGTYWILEVSHSINESGIQTTFKGARISNLSLPKIEDSFIASYRPLFSKLVDRAKSIAKQEAALASTEKTILNANTNETTTVQMGVSIPNESLVNKIGYYQNFIPYNGKDGEKYIQMVKYNGVIYLRAQVVRYGSSSYPIKDDHKMSLTYDLIPKPSGATWGDMKKYSKTMDFLGMKFNNDLYNKNKISVNKINFLKPDADPKKIKKLTLNKNIISNTNNISNGSDKYFGLIDQLPSDLPYGIAMSESLMIKLGLTKDGDVIYFAIE